MSPVRVFFEKASILLYILIPLPVFFDVSSWSLLIGENMWNWKPKIPMPIGGVCFFFIFLYWFICSFFYEKNYIRVVDKNTYLFVFYLIIITLSLFWLLNNLSLPRIIQLIFPLILLSLLSVPRKKKIVRDKLIIIIYSFFIFCFLHLISIFFYSEDSLKVGGWLVTSRDTFASFFGYGIYQSLVSYVGVLGLFSTLYLYLFSKGYYIFSIAYFCVSFLMLLAGRRASLFEFFIQIILIGMFFLVKSTISRFPRYCALFFFLYCFYLNSQLKIRHNSSMLKFEKSGIYSSRVDTWVRGYDFFSSDYLIFLFGSNHLERPHYHNFFLDTMYRIGAFGTVIYIVIFSLFFLNLFYRANFSKRKKIDKIFIFILCSQALIQSTVNTALNQPYYVISFFFSLYFILFFPTGDNYEATCSKPV